MNNKLKPIHPGEILREELLIPLNISPNELARDIKVPKQLIEWICEERVDITLDIAVRLSIYFNSTSDFWMNMQKSYENKLFDIKEKELRKFIVPYEKIQVERSRIII
ncbi:MAG: hypothetical protein AM1032_000123 [Mycoplasmataceae bacterium]|nr:MAG: hypothetical protein AM1032_000123 [Mycoplasmataceae bacterium]